MTTKKIPAVSTPTTRCFGGAWGGPENIFFKFLPGILSRFFNTLQPLFFTEKKQHAA